jgi:hypothetical protein
MSTFWVSAFFCMSAFCDLLTFVWGFVSICESSGSLVPIGLTWIQVTTILVTGVTLGFFFLDLDICQKVVETTDETKKLVPEIEGNKESNECKWCGWCRERCGESKYCKCDKKCKESKLCGWCSALDFELCLIREAGISVFLQVCGALIVGSLFLIFVFSKLGELTTFAEENPDVYGNLRGLCIYMPFLALGKFSTGMLMYYKALRKYYPLC